LKNVTLPHLAVSHENSKAGSRILLFQDFEHIFQEKSSLVFENFDLRCASRQNLFFEFCGLALIGGLASVEIATLSCFNQDFSAIL
jgi:hypothetical protein